MIPREQIGTAALPDGRQLRLFRRGEEFTIVVDNVELMNSRRTGSEEQLALEATRRLAKHPAPVFLIGGLGMGFTLKAALPQLPAKARVIVAEIVPEVIEWCRGPMASVLGTSLDDRRVELHEGDVAELIEQGAARFDAILLDVDNGPDALTIDSNDRLYTNAGLARARASLRPGGLLAIWSADRDDSFVRRLRAAGFTVDEIRSGSGGARRGARHLIWVAIPR